MTSSSEWGMGALVFALLCHAITMYQDGAHVYSEEEITPSDWKLKAFAENDALLQCVNGSNAGKKQNGRVVFSLTTIPGRIHDTKEVLESLLKQSRKADAIYLNVPDRLLIRKGEHFNKETYDMPAWLEQYEKASLVKIVRGEDFGPGTKLLGVLNIETDPDTLIICVDDDTKYHHKLAHTHLLYSTCDDSKVFGMSGITMNNGHTEALSGNLRSVPVLQGLGSVAFRRKFLDDSIFDIRSISKDCILSDDLVLANYLHSKGIDRILIDTVGMNRDNVGRDMKFSKGSFIKTGLKYFEHGDGQGNVIRHAQCIDDLKIDLSYGDDKSS